LLLSPEELDTGGVGLGDIIKKKYESLTAK
jgi:hypothetical protein